MNEHYQTGKKNKGGAAYNPINLEYDASDEGKHLAQRDEDSKVRALMRSKNIDVRSNCGYNVLTGEDRHAIDIPANQKYNPTAEAGHKVVHGGPATTYHPPTQAPPPAYQPPAQAPAPAYQPPPA